MISKVEPFALPRWVEAAPGCIGSAGAWAKKLGTRAFVGVGGSMARRTGLLAQVELSLQREGVPYEIFEGIPAEPYLETVDSAADLARSAGCDVFLGLGGGSVLDTVKLTAMLLDNPGRAEDYQVGGSQFSAPCRPVISIPTTSGTGSEATKVSVLTNRRLGVKKGVYSWEMVSTVALLDAEAARHMPPELTRETGLDALGQAIEGYLGTAANSIILAAAAQAVSLIRENLPRAVSDGSDLEARHNMLLAGFLGGVSIDCGVGLGHELAMAVGSFRRLSHGLLVGVLTPWCLQANLGWADTRIAELAHLFGCPQRSDPGAAGRDLVRALFEFNRALGLAPDLGSLGIGTGDIGEILERSRVSTSIKTNPRPQDDPLRRQVLEAAIAGAPL
jgi:alcohol dehydrogenase class IV